MQSPLQSLFRSKCVEDSELGGKMQKVPSNGAEDLHACQSEKKAETSYKGKGGELRLTQDLVGQSQLRTPGVTLFS